MPPASDKRLGKRYTAPPEDGLGSPEDVRTAIRLLRALRNWDQKQLAAAMGVDKSRLSLWERGLAPLKEADLEAVAAAARLPFPLFRHLIGIARLFRPLWDAGPDGLPRFDRAETILEMAQQCADAVAARVQLGAIELLEGRMAERERQAEAEWAARAADTESIWKRLESAPLDLWSVLTTEARDFQNRGIARRLLEESERTEATDPERSRVAALAAATSAEATVAREAGAADPKDDAHRLGERLGAQGLSAAQLRRRAEEILGRSAAPIA